MPQLTDMEIEEVSIVDKPANKRKFTIIKSEGLKMDEKMIAIMKSVIGTFKSEGDLQDAVDIIKQYADSLPDDLKGAVQHIFTKMVADSEAIAKADEIANKAIDEKVAIELAGRKLSAKTKAELTAIQDKLTALLQEDELPETPEAKMAKQVAVLQKRIDDLEKGTPELVPTPEDELKKQYEILLKRLEVVEASKGVKKELEAKPDAAIVDEWPSLKL